MRLALLILAAAAAMHADTFTGVITDSMCGTKHEMMKITPNEKCVRDCVKMGNTKYVLFDGKNSYKLSDQQAPEKFAAQKVKVTGKLFAKTGVISVEKIEAAK